MKQGWDTKKLVEVCKIGDGNHSSNYPKSSEMVSEGIPFIRANNLINGNISSADLKYITKEKHSILKKGHLKAGDILFTNRGEIGKIAIVNNEFDNANLNSQIAWFRCLEDLNNRFLFYFLLSPAMQNHYSIEKNGAALQQFTIRQINDIDISFPVFPEQQRIVAILDEAFAAIEGAKANAEQNLKNAKELFDSYLQSVFENRGEGWEEKRFDEICMLQRGFDLPTRLRNQGIYPLVSSNGITDRINLWKVKAPGVITGRSGTIGNVHYVEENYWPLNTALYIKEFYGNNERCVYYFLKQFNLDKYSSGAGVPTLNRNNVHGENVWFPKSLKEQQTIVQKLDALSAETKRLEAIYQQKIDNLEELKKSILQKAFNGEL